jgi:hypothetical protein
MKLLVELRDCAVDLLESIHVHSILFLCILKATRDYGFVVPPDAFLAVEQLREEAERTAGEGYVTTWRTETTMPARPPLAYFVMLIANRLRHDGADIDGMHG